MTRICYGLKLNKHHLYRLIQELTVEIKINKFASVIISSGRRIIRY